MDEIVKCEECQQTIRIESQKLIMQIDETIKKIKLKSQETENFILLLNLIKKDLENTIIGLK